MQRRGGFGKKGMTTRDEDWASSLFVANTHDKLLVFTHDGRVYPLHVYDVPEASRDAKGRPIVNLVPVLQDERVTAVVSVREIDVEDTALLFVSRQGYIKRTPLSAFKNLRASGMRATNVEDDDELLYVRLVTDETIHVMLFSRGGQCIRFPLTDVNLYGRTARGTFGMKLADGDVVVDVVLAPDAEAPEVDGDDEVDEPDADVEVEVDLDAEGLPDDAAEAWDTTLLTVSEFGYGCRIPFEKYRVQGRYGKGIKSFRISDKTGEVVAATAVSPDDQLMLVTDTGRVIRIAARSVRLLTSRPVQGVRLMRLEDSERIVDIERLEETDDEE